MLDYCIRIPSIEGVDLDNKIPQLIINQPRFLNPTTLSPWTFALAALDFANVADLAPATARAGGAAPGRQERPWDEGLPLRTEMWIRRCDYYIYI